MKGQRLLTLAILALSGAQATAQTDLVTTDIYNNIRYKRLEKATDFTGRSSVISQLSFISLSTALGESSITGNIAIACNRNHLFNIQINTPFNGKKRVEAVSVDGLAKDASIAFGYQFNWKRKMSVRIDAANLQQAFDTINKARKDPCDNCCAGGLQIIKRKADTIITKCDTILTKPGFDTIMVRKPSCRKYAQKFTDLSPEERLVMGHIFDYVRWLPFIGAKLKAGRKTYDYFTDASLSSVASEDLYEYEGRIYAGSSISNHASFAVSVIGQQYYDAGDKSTFLRAVSVNTLVAKQEELYMTPPALKTKLNVQIEYRHVMGEGKYALHPIVVADLSNQVLDARLQFYFLNLKEDNKIKGLNGGLFGGYRTGKQFETGLKKDYILLGVFFSPAFDINSY